MRAVWQVLIIVTSASILANALDGTVYTVPVNDVDVQAIQADVGAFGIKVGQWQEADTLGSRMSTDQPHGIVIPAGGRARMKHALFSALIIRKIQKCPVPIYIYYWGAEEDDEETRQAFQGLGEVDVVDGKSLPPPAYHRNIRIPAKEGQWTAKDGWVVKVLALYHAPFHHALLLDSDSMPLVNPTILFSNPAYRKHGCHFWPDYWMARDPQISGILTVPQPQLQQRTETGQLLLDRHRHADVLEWMWFIVTHHDIMWDLMYGDTGIFLPAFQLAHKIDFHYQSPVLPRMALSDMGTGEYMHVGLLQSSAGGHPLFMHRAGPAKFTWDSAPHHVTHVTGPTLEEQAQKLDVKAGSVYLAASETTLVDHVEEGMVDDERIAVAPVETLDQGTRTMLQSHTNRAYDCVEAWSHGLDSCMHMDWD